VQFRTGEPPAPFRCPQLESTQVGPTPKPLLRELDYRPQLAVSQDGAVGRGLAFQIGFQAQSGTCKSGTVSKRKCD